MIIAAADGSSLSNPGPAGWAWYVDDDCWHAGGWPKATNNKGELYAVVDLLRSTSHMPDEPLTILCDSTYVINAITKWMPGWKRKGWKKSDGKPVQNRELLQALDEQLTGREVSFEWVKGHSGHPMNEAADSRARAAATAYRDGGSVQTGPGFISGHNRGRSQDPQPSVFDQPESKEARYRAESKAPHVIPADLSDQSAQQPTLDLSDQGQVNSRYDYDPDIDQVIGFERELLSAAVRSDPTRVRELLHSGFSGFDSSGRIWTRNRLLASLRPLPMRVRFESIGADRLAGDLILLRWRAVAPQAHYLRSSVWKRTEGSWKLFFCQSTSAD